MEKCKGNKDCLASIKKMNAFKIAYRKKIDKSFVAPKPDANAVDTGDKAKKEADRLKKAADAEKLRLKKEADRLKKIADQEEARRLAKIAEEKAEDERIQREKEREAERLRQKNARAAAIETERLRVKAIADAKKNKCT